MRVIDLTMGCVVLVLAWSLSSCSDSGRNAGEIIEDEIAHGVIAVLGIREATLSGKNEAAIAVADMHIAATKVRIEMLAEEGVLSESRAKQLLELIDSQMTSSPAVEVDSPPEEGGKTRKIVLP